MLPLELYFKLNVGAPVQAGPAAPRRSDRVALVDATLQQITRLPLLM
jgi:hypothetical protein